MSCCYLTIPQYVCDLPSEPDAFRQYFGRIPDYVWFSNNYADLNKIFNTSIFPFRVTIIDSGGAVIYDNVTPPCYWARLNNTQNSLEYQIATLGIPCKAVVRKDFPCCPYGPNGYFYGPAASQGDYYQCNSQSGIVNCGTGTTCCGPPQAGVGCTGAPSGGYVGCTDADAITYLYSARIKICYGKARWIRFGQNLGCGCPGIYQNPLCRGCTGPIGPLPPSTYNYLSACGCSTTSNQTLVGGGFYGPSGTPSGCSSCGY